MTHYTANKFKYATDEKYVVFWISDYHATYELFADQKKAEAYRDRLLKLEQEGGTFRGRSVNHVVLSIRE